MIKILKRKGKIRVKGKYYLYQLATQNKKVTFNTVEPWNQHHDHHWQWDLTLP